MSRRGQLLVKLGQGQQCATEKAGARPSRLTLSTLYSNLPGPSRSSEAEELGLLEGPMEVSDSVLCENSHCSLQWPAEKQSSSDVEKDGTQEVRGEEQRQRKRKAFEREDEEFEAELEKKAKAKCKGKSKVFQEAFEKEWKSQQDKTIQVLQGTCAAFEEKIAEEKRREEAARLAWQYQMNKLERQIETLEKKRETVAEETRECQTQLERYSTDVDQMRQKESTDELHQLMASLLSAARAVRSAKDAKFVQEQAAKADLVTCVVCNSEQRSVLFLPCGHLSSCNGCFLRLQKRVCPVCRTPIQKSHPVILS